MYFLFPYLVKALKCLIITKLLDFCFDISKEVFESLMDFLVMQEMLSTFLDKNEKITLFQEVVRVTQTVFSSDQIEEKIYYQAVNFFLYCAEDLLLDSILIENESLLMYLIGEEISGLLSSIDLTLHIKLLICVGRSICRYMKGDEAEEVLTFVYSCRSGKDHSVLMAKVLCKLVSQLLTATATISAANAKYSTLSECQNSRVTPTMANQRVALDCKTSLVDLRSHPPFVLWVARGLTMLLQIITCLQLTTSLTRHHHELMCSRCLNEVSFTLMKHFSVLTHCIFEPVSIVIATTSVNSTSGRVSNDGCYHDLDSSVTCLSDGLEILSKLFTHAAIPENDSKDKENMIVSGSLSAVREHPLIFQICGVIDCLQELYSFLHLTDTFRGYVSLYTSLVCKTLAPFRKRVKYAILLHLESYARLFPIHFFHHARLGRNDGRRLTHTELATKFHFENSKVSGSTPSTKGHPPVNVNSNVTQQFSAHSRLTILHALIFDVTLHSSQCRHMERMQCRHDNNCETDHMPEVSNWCRGFAKLAHDILRVLMDVTPLYDDDIFHGIEQLLFDQHWRSAEPKEFSFLQCPLLLDCHVHCMLLLENALRKEL